MNIIHPITKIKLGRFQSEPDPRDKNFPVSRLFGVARPSIKQRQHWGDQIWDGNQGNTSECVGFGWTHNLMDEPSIYAGRQIPVIDPTEVYNGAQALDGMAMPHDGSTVRAGAKFLASKGLIGAYHWASNVDELARAVLELGSVVVGTDWYTSFFNPNMIKGGVMDIAGVIEGGHCYDINGVDMYYKSLRLKNSWGLDWAVKGHAYMPFAIMQQLIDQGGEICIATRLKAA